MGHYPRFQQKEKNQSFNREIERAVKSIQTKWIPREANGKKIRSQVRIPIKMVFS